MLFSWGMGLFTMARSLDEHSNFAGYHFPGTSANCFSLLHMGKDAEWGKNHTICSNVSLVHILNKQSSRSDRVMSFLRPLVLSALQNNIQFKAKHVSGIDNKIADAISRKQWESFRRLAPHADMDPSPIPEPFQLLQTK